MSLRNHLQGAYDDTQVVGMITLQVLVSTAEGGHVGVIEDFVVASQARGRGTVYLR